MSSVRCGVIGYGAAFDMGKSHGEAISRTPGLELAAICDADVARLAAAREDFPGVALFSSHHEMLGMSGLDLVVLVTPHHTHAPLAVDCLEAGKHVIVEKPMCLSVEEGKRMVAVAEDRGVLLSVFHNRRWDGSHLTLKTILASGELGEIFQIEAFSGGYAHPGHWWRSEKSISGGCLHDWGAHFIDWFLDLVPGPVIDVSGCTHKRRWNDVTNEDHAVATLRFENGVVATFEQSSLAAAPKDRLRVLGSKGAAVWKEEGEDSWTLATGDPSGTPTVRQIPFLERDESAYYRNIAGRLLRGEQLVVTAVHGLRIVSTIEAAEKSARCGHSVKPEIA